MFNMMTGSINNHLKNIKMKSEWCQRGLDKSRMNKSTPSWLRTKESDRQKEKTIGGIAMPEPRNYTLESIQNKVKSGKKLTAEEKEYLSKNDPKTLESANKAEAERANFEKDLKRCHTKEDVQRLRMQYANASISRLKAVENNPNIPLNKKLEIALEENGKTMAIQEAVKAHIISGKYAKLPTNSELREVEKEEKENMEPIVNENEKLDEDKKEIKPISDFVKSEKSVDESIKLKVKRAKASSAYEKAKNTADNTIYSTPNELKIVDKSI